MDVVGSYEETGYALLKGLVEPRVAQALLHRLAKDLGKSALPLRGKDAHPGVLKRPALQVFGADYAPMQYFLWGLTPMMSRLVGRELLPTYDFFRVYREGDVCRVHSDREACEHSLSLTLDYSDGKVWDLEIGSRPLPGRQKYLTEDFEDETYASVAMAPGDAVLYRGIHRRHGRMVPNPNRWSAHLFLHWVEAEGEYRDQAFQGADPEPGKVNFG
ncbi:MAG TPA: hypothetical protein VE053_16500 [Allosphingosinicella sp.]|nr:hypothetical protein [Allosphingosinicella sp.]